MAKYSCIFILLIFAESCVTKSNCNNFEIKRIWITWDDWQGIYRIDSLYIEAPITTRNSEELTIMLLFGGDSLPHTFADSKFTTDKKSMTMRFHKRPDFRATNFAFNNPIFLPNRNFSTNKIEEIFRKNFSYTIKSDLKTCKPKRLPTGTDVVIEMREKYIKID